MIALATSVLVVIGVLAIIVFYGAIFSLGEDAPLSQSDKPRPSAEAREAVGWIAAAVVVCCFLTAGFIAGRWS